MMNKLFFIFIATLFSAIAASAQTSSFTFQGKLNEGTLVANGSYQFQFKLYDANGVQVGNTLSDVTAMVSNGIFTVNIDFGAESFDGSPRSIEIGVRQSGSGQNYTVLNPRQPIASTPYAVKSLKSEQANTANLANDAAKLGNVPAAQYTQTNDPRLSDARTPTPFSTYYIQNGTSQQAASNFNVAGEGKANVFSANTQFNIGATRVLSAAGDFNIFVGANAGAINSTGYSNSFVGAFAGEKNTTGGFNSFFGRNAGQNNSDGNRNSFFGVNAGLTNASGGENSFFGMEAGYGNSTGGSNSFFGAYAGKANTGGSSNSFFGREAGAGNTSGDFNSFFGRNAGKANQTGTLLAFFGTNAGLKNVSGEANAFFGGEAGMENTEGDYNSFFGFTSGKNNSTGFNNSFFGAYAGRGNQVGTNNAFFGANAGLSNNANSNSFFGSGAGLTNITGASNAFFGTSSGQNNSGGSFNAFFGASAGKLSTATGNSFFGASAGENVGSGGLNTAVGYNAGKSLTTGSGNVFIGQSAGQYSTQSVNNVYIGSLAGGADFPGWGVGNQNVAIGYRATINEGVSNAMAIGPFATVYESSTIEIGASGIQKTRIYGTTTVTALRVLNTPETGGFTQLCLNNNYDVTFCGSSIRFKENVQNFNRGLELIRQLRPVRFDWKADGTADVGFIAEEVKEVEPLLATYGKSGEIQGVKYDRISAVLVNAVREQQTQIEALTVENQNLREQLKQQQAHIEALKAIVCQQNPRAALCAAPEKK